jgi:ADP-ribose pyrophosphatase
MIHFYSAREVEKISDGGGKKEEGEQIRVHVIALSGIDEWLRLREAEGILIDLKVYTGLYFAGLRE